MSGQETRLTRKRGPASRGGRGVLVGVRLQPDDLELLDLWISETDPDASRPEALRRILRLVAMRMP